MEFQGDDQFSLAFKAILELGLQVVLPSEYNFTKTFLENVIRLNFTEI